MTTTFQHRPRELRWYHAAGLLFGDWGTSRLYVLGLAFVWSGTASFWYVAAMCALVAMVGFAYTIICSHFPDGGGVYSAAKQRSQTLGVIGALLLMADYIVTAALSAYEGFRYILPAELPGGYSSPLVALYCAIIAILLIGLLNTFGLRRVGTIAFVVALVSAFLYLVIAAFCVPALSSAHIEWPHEPVGVQWQHFVNVILALSGVEAIANMTGVMAEPVARNARKAIFVVLAEVVLLNLLLGYAMSAIPVSAMEGAGFQYDDRRDHMVKILGHFFVSPWFAAISSVFFGLLLLSATNTAIGGLISLQYLLGRDRELPQSVTSLNRFGVPWVGLITATLAPALVLLLTQTSTETLAGLYAIGVVGAITINLLACGSNFELKLKQWERFTLLGVGAIALVIELTIAYDKPSALIFATAVLTAGLIARYAAQRVPLRVPAVEEAVSYEATLRSIVPAEAPRLLVATRGHPKLLKWAITYAKDKNAALFVLFVREVALAFRERGAVGTATMTLANDREARAIFERIKKLCDEAEVPMVPLYAVHDSPAELILDHAATLGVDAVLMGVSQRGAFWKTLRGDVLQEVINSLPEQIPLLIHA